MSIPSSTALAYRGEAMLNFAITEFSELRTIASLGSPLRGVG
jgi:hypothetical protein